MKELNVTPLTGLIGGLISDIDLMTADVDEDLARALAAALTQYKVLVLRDQTIRPPQMERLARCFGSTEGHHYYRTVGETTHVTVIESNSERSTTDNVWHTDGVYRAEPPKIGLLQAIVVPEKGGDTIWADMTACYNALSRPMQDLLRPLRALNDVVGGYGEKVGSSAERKNVLPPVDHPVVRTHPTTGEPILYVNPTYTTQILDLSKAESAGLLRVLFDSVATPEFQIRFKWEPGSVAIWDNMSTLHYAVSDYFPSYRKMHRVSVKGERPI